MASVPLAVIYGQRGTMPDNDDLAEQLQRHVARNSCDASWLQLLSGSAVRSGGVASALALARELMQEARAKQSLTDDHLLDDQGKSGSKTSDLSAMEVQGNVRDLAHGLAEDAIRCNSYGESCEDVGVAELRESEPVSVLGLWPELSLMNHSCAPNTSQMAVAGSVIVRATRPILEGEEVRR